MSWLKNWTRGRTLAVLLFTSLAINVLLVGGMVGRWGWHDGHRWSEGRHTVAKYWLRWTLGDEVAPRVKAMWEAHREAMKPLRQRSRDAQRAIKTALAADPFDADGYARTLEESRRQSMVVRQRHHAFMIDLAGTLTPEQRQKMAEFASRKKWRHHRD